MNGINVKERSKGNKSGRKAVTEKKAPLKAKAQPRKSLPTLPIHFRDFELGARSSRPSISSMPSTSSSSNARATISSGSLPKTVSRSHSPEIGLSNDVSSSLSTPSTANGPRITFPTTSTAVRKIPIKKPAAASTMVTGSMAASSKEGAEDKLTPPLKRKSSDGKESSAKKRKGSEKEAQKDNAKETPNKKTPSSKSSERVANQISNSMTAAHVMSTPVTTRSESRSDVPDAGDVSKCPNTSMRVLRPRKSLASPSKLKSFVIA